ncbi:glycosyltransferase family 2 protein [Puniceicoccales bacterium CK1056]|uniref:Glycosyltransferase family 2 protein n=1 Tax=Oceanipulchritudo coccoides TaxID=2706888 RepID=A0A6B2M241_9BACT|nr:glycosyltransferase family 2 protein [Oceanipulchritudo coccoides]NDV62446.1 glycosyltransferase family 2 protein [Oceanipulchritudo coccoides]
MNSGNSNLPDRPSKTPVAFLVYNRPELTRRVFEKIRQARPPILLVVADGPNPGKPGDTGKCSEVRNLITQGIDWECELKTNFSKTNLGCGKRISSGLDWVFEEVPEAIILEDDCLPDKSFFLFCDELLERYRDDHSIMQICGFQLMPSSQENDPYSYSFSRHSPIWGWASWARAWSHYDFDMKAWKHSDFSRRLRKTGVPAREVIWRNIVNARILNGQINTWDYQWDFAKLQNGSLSIVPRNNLIKNIGIGVDSTHTHGSAQYPEPQPMQFPLNHPSKQVSNRAFDNAFSREFVPSWPRIFLQRLKCLYGNLFPKVNGT